MAIYIKAAKGLTTTEEYLEDMFTEFVNSYEPNFFKCKATYLDEAYTTLECFQARRSFEDILDIIHTNYNSECTEEDLAKAMYSLWKAGKFMGIFCPDVSKLVFFKHKTSNMMMYKLVGGHGIKYRGVDDRGKGKYTLKQILDLAGQENNYKV